VPITPAGIDLSRIVTFGGAGITNLGIFGSPVGGLYTTSSSSTQDQRAPLSWRGE
jgi:hypothetical protein